MTIDELNGRIDDLKHTIAALAGGRWADPELAGEISRDYRAQLHHLKAQRAALQVEQDRAARRAELERVLKPTENIGRWFIRKLADHATSLALEHGIEVHWSGQGAFAHVASRAVWVDSALTEAGYATALHEIAHCVDAEADSRQHRHIYTERSRIAPLAECGAWQWAIRNALLWTPAMQACLVVSLGSYRHYFERDELKAYERTLELGCQRTAPAPDTAEGRERRLFLARA